MAARGGEVLTIGHSTHDWTAFVERLRDHGVTALADVRAAPYSRFNPQFNRETVAAALGACGIRYVFLGRELGGRSDDPGCYVDGRISYERLGATRSFQRGLDRVAHGAAGHRVVLMCAEGEPLECHRGLLVAPALEGRGMAVTHIGPDGRPEPHGDAMDRLLALRGLRDETEGPRLFPRPRDERVREAIARQARRFGHRKTPAGLAAPSGRRRKEPLP